MKRRVAVIQTNPTSNRKQTIERAFSLLISAKDQGAELAVLPELFHYRGNPLCYKNYAESLNGPLLTCVAGLARELSMTIIGGIIERGKGGTLYDSAISITPEGLSQAVYRKRHLFRITLGKKYVNEARIFQPGNDKIEWQWHEYTVGCAICFDIRFSEHFQCASSARPGIWCIPSNFTARTGKAHWHALLRARAIETQSYILAANCCGTDSYSGIESYGHSMIVDPWGTICAEAGNKEAVVLATIDDSCISHVRSLVPMTL